MTSDAPQQKLRGTPIVLPPWWLDRARSCAREVKRAHKWSVQRLADELTDIYGRELNGAREPWDRKTVERFLENESPTKELMEAFCLLFPKVLMVPTFVAESEAEAKALAAVAEGFRAAAIPEKTARRRDLVEEREAIEQRVRDQMAALESRDHEGTSKVVRGSGHRRNGSVGRGRPPAS